MRPTFQILGCRVDPTSYDRACEQIAQWVMAQRPAYVIAANVHVVMTAVWDPSFRTVVNQADLVTPDGMPLVWGLRALGSVRQPRVYGPDLMLAWCERAAQQGWPIFLYGGTDPMLERLQAHLVEQFPGLIVAGAYAPPFRVLSADEESEDQQRIAATGAKVLLIGLGCPKQEELMARWQGRIPVVMMGVGAAFSFHSGAVEQAPRWMMKLGLEWLFRLGQEPGRLWSRYLVNNPIFVLLFGRQLLAHLVQHWRGHFHPPKTGSQ